ncbi:tetratricopeptide repeat protein [Gaetbulibacter sp. M235]|uniref:SH3 domain-containing protein n=1 Tax=Gaetbulibacter sp. M235 TaxID=3126510 RepID=UPI00374E8232
MKQILYILIALFSAGMFAQNQSLFEQGNQLYNQGKYAEAIEKYKAILETNNHSEALYFNLANAHYKLNHIAPSIFYYEKALKLAPEDQDIKNNLAFAKNMTIDAIDTIPDAGFSKVIKKITDIMSFDDWSKVAVASVIIFVLLILLYYFTYSTNKKRLAFITSNIFLFIAAISLLIAFHKYNLSQKDKPAIIFAQETVIKSEPNNRSQELFRLHEGTKVQILDTINQWREIKLADGKTGWIEKEDIKEL